MSFLLCVRCRDCIRRLIEAPITILSTRSEIATSPTSTAKLPLSPHPNCLFLETLNTLNFGHSHQMAPVVEKRGKKRSAAAEAGPKSKKVQLDKQGPAADKGKKRSRPVTLPVKEVSDDSSDEMSEEEQEEDEAVEAVGEPSQVKDPNGACLILQTESLILMA